MKRILAVLLLCSLPVGASAEDPPADSATAEPPASWTLDGARLVRGEANVALPCTGTASAAREELLFVACDSGGLLVVDMRGDIPRPVEIRRMLEAVPARGLRTVDGEVWVETPLGSRPLSAFETQAPPSTTPPPEPTEVEQPDPVPAKAPPKPAEEPASPKEAASVGEVVSVGTGFVVINLGSDDSLAEEGWVEFFRFETVDLGAGQSVQRERRLGVGQIDTVSENRAKVELGLNERIPVGAQSRKLFGETPSSLRRTIVPPRPRAVWEVELNVRPFLPLQTLGAGAIIDGSVGYHFDKPVAVDLFIHPFGFGIARDGDILTFAGNAIVSYDTTAFQIGLGAGASRINTLPVGGTDFLPEGSEEPSFRAGFSAAQFVRLGSVDGLHVSVLNNFILFEDEFVFGGITLDGSIPLKVFRDPAWIIARGGGGVPGHIFAELGIRILARGNGGPGSIFFTPTVGGGMLTGERWGECQDFRAPVDPRDPEPEPRPGICRNEYNYGGPLVGFGVEWRF